MLADFPLTPLAHFTGRQGPLLLIVMDGVGLGKRDEFDAVHLAKTPVLDRLFQSPLYAQIKAHGTTVGMPSDEDMGNSEVGHNTLGAGRSIPQGATLVNNAIESGTLFNGASWKNCVANCHTHNSTLHFLGLLSDGNVHSHINHLEAMLWKAAQEGISKVRLHVLLDGRDVGQKTALLYIDQLEATLQTIQAQFQYDYRIASGGGRMVTTMDRYNADWEIVERGWKAHALGQAREFGSARQAVETFYAQGMTDQYLDPFVVADAEGPVGKIRDHDSVICFNFRGDRVIEISKAFTQDNLPYFDRQFRPQVFYAGMMQYDGDEKIPQNFLVSPPQIEGSISQYLCQAGITAFAISETQKYGHVTYFWNGNKSGYVNRSLEEYVEIPSDKVPFDQKPEMKAREITDKTIELLKSGQYRFGRVNLANGDMVGHTGVLDAAIKAVEVTDECVGRLVDCVNELGGITVILADHGNADEMGSRDKNGVVTPKTSHTLNPVPFVIVDSGYQNEYHLANLACPGLNNVGATLCNLLGFEKPAQFDASLITFS